MPSITGLTGGRGGLTYTAAKHAIVGMTKNVASHYGSENIRCNALAPAAVQSGFSAAMKGVDDFGMEASTRGVNLMPRAGTVEEIANMPCSLPLTIQVILMMSHLRQMQDGAHISSKTLKTIKYDLQNPFE
ncbi:SDR family oxidoreductase [Salinicoccus siamensis]|uniref:SDR family oxidoreductase n=1 Tax=Salinicoccus siamensis TaxID=381830 RepID=A0ABV5Z3V7_9STAP